jgi:NAD-dependent SIR2 family protein deacetylase
VFYTGAGISRDIVPDMKTLEQQLHVGTSKEFVSEFDKNPDSILESWNSFASKCCSGKTTEAHSALARIARIKSAPIFTENVDFLQEYS